MRRTTTVRTDDATPPLLGDGTTAPERGDVSVRYLAGTFLSGVIALGLMGGALWGAAEGTGSLAVDARPAAPPIVAATRETRGRLPPPSAPRKADNDVMNVPMLVATAEGTTVRSRPFARISLPLDAGHSSGRATPRFDPLAVFRPADADASGLAMGAIYGASVDTDVNFRRRPLEPSDLDGPLANASPNNVAAAVAVALTPEATHAERHALLPQTHATRAPANWTTASRVRVLSDNVSVASARVGTGEDAPEQIVYVTDGEVADSLASLAGEEGERFAGALAALQAMGGGEPPEAAALKLAFAREPDGSARLVRAGLYDGDDFRAAVAIDDKGRLAPAHRPSGLPPEATEVKTERPLVLDRSLHEALHQTAYANELPDDATARLVELVASGTDFRSAVSEGDRVDVLMALPEGADAVTAEAEMVYVDAVLDGQRTTLYRHTVETGRTGWYDSEGRGARPFLLRNPVPQGRFRSPFGMRRHPIRKRMRMHWGVDWAAPGGTPIMASADGVVEEARWAGGNGRRVILKHANGYKTSYSHQRRFAKGIRPGARVQQGQIIGYVGTTGLSTGNHLHYELSINGERVDPMRVRLPASEALKGDELVRFQDARLRIDELLADDAG